MFANYFKYVIRGIAVLIFALAIILPMQATRAGSSPFIFAGITEENRVECRDWPLDAEVSISINDTDYNAGPVIAATEGSGTLAAFDLGSDYQLKSGDEITATDGTTSVTYTVTEVAITDVDITNETVSGTVDPAFTAVFVRSWPSVWSGTATRDVPVSSGEWTADFTDTGSGGADIQQGSAGVVMVADVNGNATRLRWRAPEVFAYFDASNKIEGNYWHYGDTITLSIDDGASGYADSTTVGWASLDSNQTYFVFDLGAFDLQPGHIVTVTDTTADPDKIVKFTVQDFAVTGFDLATDTVSGTSDPSDWLYVDRWTRGWMSLHVQADDSGDWNADFADGEIDADDNGIVRYEDLAGGTSAIHWTMPHKVGLVTDAGGTADMSFNWMAYQGLLNAEADMNVDGTLYQPATSGDYGTALQQCVDEHNEVCFAVGFFMADAVATAAADNPGVNFAILDFSPDAPPANLRGIVFNEKQVGYLAGALAGKMTTADVIGGVGGMKIPPVIAFLSGYRNGAQCANPDVKVLTRYTGTFFDETVGANTAQFMMSQGADVIYAAAGPTGNGAIKYSAGEGVWSIGVDSDQYISLFDNGSGSVPGSDKLLTSSMKRLDTAVYKTIDDYLNGSFTSGTVTYSLVDNGVGLAPYHDTESSISSDIKSYIDDTKAGIIGSSIDIDEPCHDPTILVDPDNNEVSGENWLPNDALTISVDSVGAGGTTTDADGVPTFSWDTGFHYDLHRGQTVAVTDGTHTKTVEIKNLRFDYVNQPTDDIASGRGPSGEAVDVYVQTDLGEAQINNTAITSGAWQADFGSLSPPLNLDNIQEASATSYDADGDGTLVHLQTATRFAVQPDHGWVQGWNWPAEIEVTVAVNNVDDFSGTVLYTAKQTPGDDLSVWFQVEPDLDLIPGYYVQVTNGIITKTTKIEEVHLDTVVENRVYGRGPAGATAGVFVQTDVDEYYIGNIPIDDPEGTWMADFGAVHPSDFQNLQDVNVEVYDADGDGTAAHLPYFIVQPDHGWINANGWAYGSEVTVTVDDDIDPADPLFSASYTIGTGDYSSANFTVEPTIDLIPGQYVWVSDGPLATSTQVKFQQIQELHFDAVDETADTASGSGPASKPGRAYIRTDIDEKQINIQIEAGGTWLANFSGMLDVQNVQDANVEVLDEDRDTTMAHLMNNPPTVALSNGTASLPENTSTAGAVKVADITITDEGIGVNNLSLSGADASLFEITGDALYIKAGTALNFETNPSLDVTVNVDDTSVGTTPDDSESMSIALTNVADYEIAKNGGFETYIGTSKKPASWVAVNFSTLDGKNTTHQAGKYSVKLTGKGTITKTLTQTLTGGSKGDIFAFSYWVKGSALPKTGTCQGQVILYKTGGGTSTYTLKCPTTATTFTWKQMKLNFTASANYSKVVIMFTFKKTSGSVWFDSVSLKR